MTQYVFNQISVNYMLTIWRFIELSTFQPSCMMYQWLLIFLQQWAVCVSRQLSITDSEFSVFFLCNVQYLSNAWAQLYMHNIPPFSKSNRLSSTNTSVTSLSEQIWKLLRCLKGLFVEREWYNHLYSPLRAANRQLLLLIHKGKW